MAIEQMTDRLDSMQPVEFDWTLLATVAERIGRQQELFAQTGASHAAGAFRLADGRVDVVREDIGRHNAVDKVVGRLLLDGRLPATGLGLFLSGRASFEMVQKAWAAGFATVVAVTNSEGNGWTSRK